MKHILLILTFFTGFAFAAKAQDGDPGDKQEKLQALYVAYITDELKLTPDEAQKFWPIHAEFDKEIKAVNPDLPQLEREQAILNIKKRYQDKFSKIINADRTERFFKKDGEFRRKLIERLRKMREKRQNQPRPALRRG
jgi:hypothetical protein